MMLLKTGVPNITTSASLSEKKDNVILNRPDSLLSKILRKST
jgi:hypothetical protein